MLPKWANVNEERFHEILSAETKAKNEGLEISVDERETMLDITKRLLKDFLGPFRLRCAIVCAYLGTYLKRSRCLVDCTLHMSQFFVKILK